MNETQHRVLVIDDDRISQRFICKSLEQHFSLQTANDGEAGLSTAKDWQPNIIILDVDMPGQTGFDVCKRLKLDELTSNIPIIFVSGHGALESRLQGFELGADDYLVKPCEKEIIKAKVDYLLSIYHEKKDLSDQVSRAQYAARIAMSEYAELGRAIRFVSSTYLLPSFDDLAHTVFQVMRELELNSSLVFFSSAGELYYSASQQDVTPLEREVFQMMHSEDRFCDFGNRTLCNYPHVSLLVKNMPLDDKERYGRLKDTLTFILSATDEKVRALDTHMAILDQASSLARSTDAIRATLASITDNATNSQERITEIMHSLLEDFDDKLPTMGLEEDQEKYIVERVDTAFTDAIACLDEGKDLKKSLTGIIRLLSHLIAQQKKIVEDDVAANELKNNSGDNNDYADIELF